MSYYKTCPECGSHLDPGERCDCRSEKTATDAANIDGGGKIEQVTKQTTIRPHNTTGGERNAI